MKTKETKPNSQRNLLRNRLSDHSFDPLAWYFQIICGVQQSVGPPPATVWSPGCAGCDANGRRHFTATPKVSLSWQSENTFLLSRLELIILDLKWILSRRYLPYLFTARPTRLRTGSIYFSGGLKKQNILYKPNNVVVSQQKSIN